MRENQESATFQKSTEERITRKEMLDRSIRVSGGSSGPRSEQELVAATLSMFFGKAFHKVADAKGKKRSLRCG